MLSGSRPEHVAVNLVKIIEKAATGTMWIVENEQPAYKYEMPDRFKIPKIFCE